MNDTTPAMEQKMREMMAKKSPVERMLMGCSMYDTAKYLVTLGILDRNPTISKIELKTELFLRFYGNDFTKEQCEKILTHLKRYWEKNG